VTPIRGDPFGLAGRSVITRNENVNVNWRGAAVKNGSKLNCIKIFRISVHFVRYLPCFLFA